MPAKLDRCVTKLMKDPNFKSMEGKTKEQSAWAVCTSSLKKDHQLSDIVIDSNMDDHACYELHDQCHVMYMMRKMMAYVAGEESLKGIIASDIEQTHEDIVSKMMDKNLSHSYKKDMYIMGAVFEDELDSTLSEDMKKKSNGYDDHIPDMTKMMPDKEKKMSVISLSEKSDNGYEIVRTGNFKKFNPNTKEWENIVIQESDIDNMINNFNNDTLQRIVGIDVEHHPEWGNIGEFKNLNKMERDFKTGTQTVLTADIEWTNKGKELIADRKFPYFSANFAYNYKDKETDVDYGTTLLGSAVTTRPFVPGMKSVNSSDVYIDDYVIDNAEKFGLHVAKIVNEDYHVIGEVLCDVPNLYYQFD